MLHRDYYYKIYLDIEQDPPLLWTSLTWELTERLTWSSWQRSQSYKLHAASAILRIPKIS